MATLYLDKIVLFAMIVARVGSMVLSAPVFGARTIPIHLRIFLAMTLATLVVPLQWNVGVTLPTTLIAFLSALVIEILIGLSLGLAILILFSGIQVAGNLVAQTSGAAVSNLGGNENSAPVASRLLQILALAIFVAAGGHRLMMTAILDSFQALPPAGAMLPEDMVGTMTMMVSESFRMAMRAAAPAITALLAAMLLVGLASRALPQLNIFTIGFAINIWATLLALLFSLAAIGFLFSDYAASFINSWQDSLVVGQ